MKTRWITGPLGGMLLFASMAFSQDGATAEAKRQGTVALKPDAQSPAQSMSQAVAFERYKELAAEREARKEGTSSADRSVETPRPVKAVKKVPAK